MSELRIEWRKVSPYDSAYVIVDGGGRQVGAPCLTKTGARWRRRKLRREAT